MARLGDWEYPEINLSASIDVARKITREFSGEVSRTGLARSLGMSERGGAFASRLAAIRLWGIATGRSRIRLTRDGLRAARPHSPSEAQSAMRDLAQSVPLFVELGKRLPQSSPGTGTPRRLRRRDHRRRPDSRWSVCNNYRQGVSRSEAVFGRFRGALR